MKLLLPRKFKLLGILLLIPSMVLGILVVYYDFSFSFLNLPKPLPTANLLDLSDYNLTNEFALTGMIIGLLMIAFAREKHEDEFINKLRLESLQWAVIINYLLLLFATWFINGASFLQVMVYNMLTVLVIFIVCFHLMLIRAKINNE
jgi:hypothetical protein